MHYTDYLPLLISLFHSCIRKSRRDNYKGDPEWWSKITHWTQMLQETDIKKKGKITLSIILSSIERKKTRHKKQPNNPGEIFVLFRDYLQENSAISETPTSIIHFTYVLLYKYFSELYFTFIIQVYQNTNISWCETGDIKQSILRSSNSVLFYPKPS